MLHVISDDRKIAKQSLRQLKIINNEINLSSIQVASNYRDVSLPRHDVHKVSTYSNMLLINVPNVQVSDTTKMPLSTTVDQQKN